VTRARRSGQSELVGVGVLFGAVLVATLVTYARVDPEELYNVSEEGLAGGLGRALVELNFPVSLMAVPIALVAVDVLRTRAAAVLGAIAVVLCFVAAIPGAVDQDDLDAKPVNAIPAAGVVLTIGLVVAAFPRLSAARPRLPGDPVRLAIAAVVAVAAIPYLFADLGFYAPDPILADEPSPDEDIAAVHLGSHEGMDGALLAVGALAISRLLPWFAARRLANVTSALLALALVYGLMNLAHDDWLEQVEKREWTDWGIPKVVRPELSWAWAVIVAAAVAVEVLWFRRERRDHQPALSSAAGRA
jgi:hypothetical protein